MAETNLTADYQTFAAAGDLSVHQYNAVMYYSNGQVGVCSGDNVHNYVGILANAPSAAGRAASVVVAGAFKARAGAAIASYGIPLSSNTSGRVATATSGDIVIGYNIETASADGDIISVQLQRPYRIGPF